MAGGAQVQFGTFIISSRPSDLIRMFSLLYYRRGLRSLDQMVSWDFVIEDMLGYNGMWLLGEIWVVRDFEVFGSVETRE